MMTFLPPGPYFEDATIGFPLGDTPTRVKFRRTAPSPVKSMMSPLPGLSEGIIVWPLLFSHLGKSLVRA